LAALYCFHNVIELGLNYLEQTLPYNSHVLFVGLVDGRVLWDIMHDQIHRTECQTTVSVSDESGLMQPA